jgi:hypothetical protein
MVMDRLKQTIHDRKNDHHHWRDSEQKQIMRIRGEMNGMFTINIEARYILPQSWNKEVDTLMLYFGRPIALRQKHVSIPVVLGEEMTCMPS